MGQAQILLLGKDVTDRAKDLIKIVETKTAGRNKLLNNVIKIVLNNPDDVLTPNNSKSFLNGINFYYEPVQIFNRDGELIWDGILKNVLRNHNNKTVTIETINKLHKFKDIKIVYTGTNETPATSALNIINQVGFADFDAKTIQDSINLLNANNVKVDVEILEEDNLTFMEAIEKLGEYAVADVYNRNNKLHFKTWTPFTGGSGFVVSEKEIDKAPNVKGFEKELVNNYAISFKGDNGTPATDVNSGGIGSVSRARFGCKDLPEFSRGSKSIIQFTDKSSAVFIGEQYIERSHIDLSTNPRPPDNIAFRLKADNRNLFTIDSFFKFNFTAENWVNKVFEVFKTDIDENQNIVKIDALEIQT